MQLNSSNCPSKLISREAYPIENFIKACELNKLDPVGFFNLGASYLLVSKYDLAL